MDLGETVGNFLFSATFPNILWLHSSVVLGGVTREHEPFWERLFPDARAEARRPNGAAFLHLQGVSELIDAVARVGVVDGTRAESTGGQAPRGPVGWRRTPAMLTESALGL